MKFSENWLRSWVNPDLSSEALAHALTMAGLEVEALEAVAPNFNDVVIAEVLSVTKHPDADRLNVCTVNVGEAEPLTIVCGAKNVAAGLKVPCARIGAVLPGDFQIKKAKVRGIESFGMLCAEQELGLTEESQGLWILPEDAPIGTNIRDYFGFDDKLFTLKLTPNRSDCSGMLGIAREVSALTGTELVEPSWTTTLPTINDSLNVTVNNTEACPLYCGQIIRGVNAQITTPNWIKQRLERSGLRTINIIVDITNYVMLELGQPMHAFDLNKLQGGLFIRQAKSSEKITLLNEQEVLLNESVLVIADQESALAIAGVMGGLNSSVENETQDIFLESAFFHPDTIAGRARQFGLATDSSFRFERGVDFGNTQNALNRATQLIIEICGGQAGAVTRIEANLPERQEILLRTSRIKRVLGVTFSNQEVSDLLLRLQLSFTAQEDDFLVTAPSYRFDLEIEADLIEELARLYGYDNIQPQRPRVELAMLPHSENKRSLNLIKQLLVARDYQEIISYAFVDAKIEETLSNNKNPVALQNPIASNLAVMRSSLIGGLVEALSFNVKRKQVRVRLFEAGSCFSHENGHYTQTDYLSALAYGTVYDEQWGISSKNIDFYDVKADLEALFAPRRLSFETAHHPALHPGRSAQVSCNGVVVGWIGELHPEWQQQFDLAKAPVWFEIKLEALLDVPMPRMNKIAKFLPIRRDLAIVVDENVTVQSLLDTMSRANAPFVSNIDLFDVYRGQGIENGKKSLAFQILMQDTDKNLTDSEIEPSMTKLVEALQQQGAQLRI